VARRERGDGDGEGHGMATRRLLQLKLDRRELGFCSARVVREDGEKTGWMLRVESPSEMDPFRDHMHAGASLNLNMLTVDGDRLVGDACVASLSDSIDSATVVVLSGMGPLRRA
jgi:hypothetical protein